MQSRLIVKNFGPIKEVDLDLRNVNVFIGPQATGKSALAKIYTIFKAPRKFFKIDVGNTGVKTFDSERAAKDFEDVLEEYNIRSFLNNFTEIEFDSELHSFSYNKGKVTYTPKLLGKIESLETLAIAFDKNKEKIDAALKNLTKKFVAFSDFGARYYNLNTDPGGSLEKLLLNLNEDNFSTIIKRIKEIEIDLSTNTAFYIPAERNFINIIKKSSLNLILNKVPIPKHILSFGAELEKLETKEIDLGFLKENLKYRVVNGEDRIFTDDRHSIALTEAASGIQSSVPLLLSISRSSPGHRSFVIEEPELNLFPIAQYQLIQQIESNRLDVNAEDVGTIHTYTTHSPYILSALNNLLYVHKVSEVLFNRYSESERKITKLDDIISEYKKMGEMIGKIVSAVIDPNSFTAYQINNGTATSIFNRETGLIEENYIDEATDKINEDFEALMELMK